MRAAAPAEPLRLRRCRRRGSRLKGWCSRHGCGICAAGARAAVAAAPPLPTASHAAAPPLPVASPAAPPPLPAAPPARAPLCALLPPPPPPPPPSPKPPPCRLHGRRLLRGRGRRCCPSPSPVPPRRSAAPAPGARGLSVGGASAARPQRHLHLPSRFSGATPRPASAAQARRQDCAHVCSALSCVRAIRVWTYVHVKVQRTAS